MSDNLDTRVSLSLHPEAIQIVEGYSEETAHYLAPLATALSEAREGISKVHTAREKARSNPTWNEAQQLIHTQDLADKVFAKVAPMFDRVKRDLDANIRIVEAELSTPLTSRASHPLASEIRAHAKKMDAVERASFIQKAIDRGDEMTASSVLGSPSYLSGLSDEMQDGFTKMWHRARNPATANKLKVMQGGRDLLMDRAGLIHAGLLKAVGEHPSKVAALRRAKNDSEAAFILSST